MRDRHEHGRGEPRAPPRSHAKSREAWGCTDCGSPRSAGDDVLDVVRSGTIRCWNVRARRSLGDAVLSANAYMGVAGIIEALRGGADIVITGRVGDPALFLAPLVHEFGWELDDWDLLGKGTVVGHLLECAGQITGGYFADPGYKDVPDLARLGFPIAEVAEDGWAMLTKVAGSGGGVSVRSCKEQLLYELLDPTKYLQPDVVADFSSVRLELGARPYGGSGGTGTARPDTLKVSVGYARQLRGRGADLLRRPRSAGARAVGAGHRAGAVETDRRARRRNALRPDRRRRGASRPAARWPSRRRCASALPAAPKRWPKPCGSATKWRRCTPTGRPAAVARRNRHARWWRSCPR